MAWHQELQQLSHDPIEQRLLQNRRDLVLENVMEAGLPEDKDWESPRIEKLRFENFSLVRSRSQIHQAAMLLACDLSGSIRT